MLFYQKDTKHIQKYQLVTAEPPFAFEMIERIIASCSILPLRLMFTN